MHVASAPPGGGIVRATLSERGRGYCFALLCCYPGPCPATPTASVSGSSGRPCALKSRGRCSTPARIPLAAVCDRPVRWGWGGGVGWGVLSWIVRPAVVRHTPSPLRQRSILPVIHTSHHAVDRTGAHRDVTRLQAPAVPRRSRRLVHVSGSPLCRPSALAQHSRPPRRVVVHPRDCALRPGRRAAAAPPARRALKLEALKEPAPRPHATWTLVVCAL